MSEMPNGADADSPEDRRAILEDLGKAANDLMAGVDETAAQTAKSAVVAASELSDAINKQSGALAAKANAEIRAHPLAAAALAVFAGAVIGLAFSRLGKSSAKRI